MKTLISIFILSLWAVSTSAFSAPPFELPAKANEIAKGVYDLGTAVHNGRTVRGYAFVRYRKDYAKPTGTPGKGGGGDTTSTCFALIAKGAKWKGGAEDYVLDEAGISIHLDPSFVAAQIATATGLWNNEVALIGRSPIFGSRDTTNLPATFAVDTVAPDDYNEIMFGSVADSNTIAVTTVWGEFGGPPRKRVLVEWDQIYNSGDWNFGDAYAPSSTVMDMLNIAAHEVGHAAGMGHPDLTCAEETMHATAALNETKKRNLNAGDIAGIKDLYK